MTERVYVVDPTSISAVNPSIVTAGLSNGLRVGRKSFIATAFACAAVISSLTLTEPLLSPGINGDGTMIPDLDGVTIFYSCELI